MIVQYCAPCTAEMLHNTKHRDSSVNIPLSPDQHHCSDEAKWRIGGCGKLQTFLISLPPRVNLTDFYSLSHRSTNVIRRRGSDDVAGQYKCLASPGQRRRRGCRTPYDRKSYTMCCTSCVEPLPRKSQPSPRRWR